MNGRQARIARVRSRLQASGVSFEWRELDANTATAPLAAEALGCPVAQIAKSVVFRRDDSAVIAVLCGDQRVDTAKLRALIGAPLKKADADFVREQSGFEIGGVPPVDHPQSIIVMLEDRLRQHPVVWAAAGSAYTVFGVTPEDLAVASGGRFGDFAE